MTTIFEDQIFTLIARDSSIVLGLTLSEIESIWKMSRRFNKSLHSKVDQFIKEWQRKLE